MASFAVSRAHRQLIEANRPSIEAKFRVSVQLNSYDEPESAPAPAPAPAAGTGTATDAHGHCPLPVPGPGDDEPDSTRCPVITDEGSGQMWVEIGGYEAIPAKNHIISLCHDFQVKEELPSGFGDLIVHRLDSIAAETLTRISQVEGTDTLILSGCDETSLATACSMISEECSILKRRQEASQLLQETNVLSVIRTAPDFYLDSQMPTAKLCTESLQGNSPQESSSDPDKSRNSSPEKSHAASLTKSTPLSTFASEPDLYGVPAPYLSDVGRTMVAGEGPRLIPHSVAPARPSLLRDAARLLPEEAQSRDSRTLSLVNSMQKLGFSRGQVEVALRQLGPAADHNDILGALVNQRSARTDLEEEAGEEVRAHQEGPARSRDISDGFPAAEVAEDDADNLRPIIIDGSNVAMSFGNKDIFACRGIEIVVNWFYEHGHRKVFVFVPNWRKEASKPDSPITDQAILTDLKERNILVWTPSRRINGRRIVCYDDRYILKTAVEEDGIIVSNDNFRDIQNERPEWRKVIEERLLMYSFVNDRFMPPDDPLGRHGPSLENFLRMKPTMPDHLPQACPYGKKCTYGNKCKYYHADRHNRHLKSISETLKERDKRRKERATLGPDRSGSPRFSAVASAPIPGYVPPEDLGTSPERHTTPLPGPSQQPPPPSKHGRIASESSALQMSPRQSGSPRHVHTAEAAVSQAPYLVPREEVYRVSDLQPYTSPMGRSSHSAPLPAFGKRSEGLSQRDLYTVPLQRYPSPTHSDRGYPQLEEPLLRNRMPMQPALYGSGEALGVTPSGTNFERRSSHNDLLSDFQRMGIHEQSGMPLSREPQLSYGFRQSPQQYHSSEPFPGQPISSQRPEEPSQTLNQHLAYRSGESFIPSHSVNSDPLRYPSPSTAQAQTQGYPSPNQQQQQQQQQQQPRPYYGGPIGSSNSSGGGGLSAWHSSPSRLSAAAADQGPTPSAAARRGSEPQTSLEEQRKYILHHLASQFGRDQAAAVMQRHPHETNPKRLIMYMSTNT